MSVLPIQRDKENRVPECVGCLGSQRCWVCLGQGVIDASRGMVVPCHRCFATGLCTECQRLRIADLGHPIELSVEDQRVQAARTDSKKSD